MLHHKRNLLSVSLATAIALAATGANAQNAAAEGGESQNQATNLDTVVVTGIRRGIESAISVKRDSSSIVEAVSAEDIGKLPDVSIAESIARLPGLAAQRVAGRAQVISVRGLSPDFATTLLNGREMVSTGDNRSVEFDQYPSELISGVTVYKTPDSGLVGQGLSGTIDMQTVRPLSFGDRVISISGRYQKNSLGEAAGVDPYGNRLNVSFVDKFADGTLGIALGYSHSDMSKQENQVGLYEPWQQVGDGWRPGVEPGTWYADGIKALRRTGNAKRDGVMGTVQYRPNNTWTSTLDAFYTEAEEYDTANQLEIHIGDFNGGYDRLDVDNAAVNGNGSFTGGVARNVYPLVRGMYNHREDNIKAFGWKNELSFDRFRIEADVSWSKAERDETNLENNLQRLPAPQLDSVTLDFSRRGFPQMTPGLDYSNPADLYLANTIYGSGYGKVPHVDDELRGFRLSASINAPESMSGWLADIDVGVNFADRKKNKTQAEGNINLGAQGESSIAADLQYAPVDLGFAGAGVIPAWNVPAAVARYMEFNPTTAESYLVPKQWTVEEEITTSWFRANIDTMVGSVPMRGNIGVQAQRVDQSSSSSYWDGSQPVGSQVIPIRDGKSYTDFLPSMNLSFELPAENTLRFAMARQVARPRVDQLRAAMEFGVDTSTGRPGASGGNPNLDPWVANAVDVSWEKYFGNRAYVAAAVFYKDLRSYIYTQTRDGYDFSNQVEAWLDVNGDTIDIPVQVTGNYSAPFNGQGGSLRGAELTASLPLDLFTDALRGFGVVASASFNDSDIQILDPESASSVGTDPIMLPGLSKRVYNFTAYYENSGFEVRVNQRKRSDFIGEIGNFNGNRTLRYVEGEDVIDAQVAYTFADGSPMRGLSLYLQGSNLNNSRYHTYAGSKDRPLETVEWGRTWLVGASYRF